ncbi:unnamed protein product [Onchocerca flexuosa]|uniref:Uncharacterized protein n=1 Tax=Onchocerca flexuosa TaxID=387005 RepID=A0A183HK67_9BILA|nr:unnamed protein product [Onchocerca flexuosa]
MKEQIIGRAFSEDSSSHTLRRVHQWACMMGGDQQLVPFTGQFESVKIVTFYLERKATLKDDQVGGFRNSLLHLRYR